MSRRMDITSCGHKIRVEVYILYLDVKMHIDELDDMDIATIDRIKRQAFSIGGDADI